MTRLRARDLLVLLDAVDPDTVVLVTDDGTDYVPSAAVVGVDVSPHRAILLTVPLPPEGFTYA